MFVILLLDTINSNKKLLYIVGLMYHCKFVYLAYGLRLRDIAFIFQDIHVPHSLKSHTRQLCQPLSCQPFKFSVFCGFSFFPLFRLG